MSPTWVTFLFEVANFILLAALLGWLFFRPVRDALERRRVELETDQRIARETRAEADRILQDARTKRAELESSSGDLHDRLKHEAELERARLVEDARAQMQREREMLKGELGLQRRAQARSLVRDATQAAREIVVRLLEKMDGPDLEQALLRTACRELAEMQSAGSLKPIVIESARALEDGALVALTEAASVQPGDVDHHVDPALMAGLRILTAKGLVDVSASGLAREAERLLLGQLERESPNDV